VVFSSTAASVIVTPNSMVRMIVSATTDGGQALASGKGHLGGVGEARVWEPASSPTEAPPHRSDTNPTTRQSPTTRALSFPKSPVRPPAKGSSGSADMIHLDHLGARSCPVQHAAPAL